MQKKVSKKPSNSNEIIIDISKLLIPLSIIISGFIIGGTIYFSSAGKSNSYTQNTVTGDSAGSAGEDTTGNTNPQPTAGNNQNAETTIDDDPYLGDISKAKVAIVEFSDYECPFCKRHFTETYQQIKEKYVDTGKAIMVFRDFPLSFHDPAATLEATAANCVKSLGGDSKYYTYHDLIFQNTPGNGTGLTKDRLTEFATQLGITVSSFQSCLNSDQYKNEIAKDIQDGSAAGVTGTPGFVVGKLGSDGSVKGVLITGAYPFAEFEKAIDSQLGE